MAINLTCPIKLFKLNHLSFILEGSDARARLSSTVFVQKNETVSTGPVLPNPSHCAVTGKNGSIFILGGYPSMKQVLIHDSITNSSTTGPSMQYNHYYHACAVFNSALHNGREVILVAGGWHQDTTEIWDYQTEGSSWIISK